MVDHALPPIDDALIDRLLQRPESITFECKRIGKIDRLLESVVALANTEGGMIALGLGRARRGERPCARLWNTSAADELG